MPASCFSCGHPFEAATGVDGEAYMPEPGDPSLCIRCGGLAIFTGRGLELRRATDRELLEFRTHPDVIRARRLLERMWAEIGRPS